MELDPIETFKLRKLCIKQRQLYSRLNAHLIQMQQEVKYSKFNHIDKNKKKRKIKVDLLLTENVSYITKSFSDRTLIAKIA